MAILSMAQIEAYARGAGFAGNDFVIAGAIAEAESSGRTDVVNFVPCVGLWQINIRAHPQYTMQAMKDPAQNASAAYAIFRSEGWQAWSTYTSGAYKRYLGKAAASASATDHIDLGKIPGVGPAIAVVSNLGKINTALDSIMDPTTWRRIAFMLVGVIMIMIGVVKMSATQKTIKAAIKVAEVVK